MQSLLDAGLAKQKKFQYMASLDQYEEVIEQVKVRACPDLASADADTVRSRRLTREELDALPECLKGSHFLEKSS